MLTMSSELKFVRTGKITMRAEPYLIMRFSTGYHALHGPQCARVTIGIYDTVEAAKTACEAHNASRKENAPTV
jgi:hypothetical protein